MKFLYVLSISVLLILGGQVNAGTQDKAEIQELIEKTYASNVKSGNGKWYASLFSKNAQWMPPKAQDRYGQTDIAFGFTDMVRDIKIEPTLVAEDIQIMTSTVAYVVGKAQVLIRPKDGSSPKNINLRMVWIMSKDSGKWMITRQIWNQKP
ncbi:MAG: SgcJ/EcaC family oxidoreductase [Gammaproteobacteria bacterium]|nr:SgcJ/EcaC family oxidoreductase [Gammaproteobacteria bacterium]